MTTSTWKLTLGCAALFAAGFVGSVVTRSQAPVPAGPTDRSPLARWLDLDAETAKTVDEHDPTFYTRLTELRQRLEQARSDLARMFEAGTATDEAIKQQAEQVITARDELERHVLDYLLTVRDHLSVKQQKKLFGLCAESVRHGQGQRRRWRGGRGQGQGASSEGDGWRGGRGHGDSPEGGGS